MPLHTDSERELILAAASAEERLAERDFAERDFAELEPDELFQQSQRRRPMKFDVGKTR